MWYHTVIWTTFLHVTHFSLPKADCEEKALLTVQCAMSGNARSGGVCRVSLQQGCSAMLLGKGEICDNVLLNTMEHFTHRSLQMVLPISTKVLMYWQLQDSWDYFMSCYHKYQWERAGQNESSKRLGSLFQCSCLRLVLAGYWNICVCKVTASWWGGSSHVSKSGWLFY